MNSLNKLLLTTICATSIAQAGLQGPIVISNPTELAQQRQLEASADAAQWVSAFHALLPRISNQIEIVTIKDGETLTISNVYKLEKAPDFMTEVTKVRGNLVIATQRIANRDLRVVLDPRQIRYIRETSP